MLNVLKISGSNDLDSHDRLRHVSTKVRHHSANLRERLGTGDRKMSAASSGGTGDASDPLKQVCPNYLPHEAVSVL